MIATTQHGFFDRPAIQQHGAARMAAATAEHHRFGQVFRTIEFGLDVLVIGVKRGHVLINRLGLVELALALKIHRQAEQIAHQRVVERHPAKAVKSHVQLTLTLQGQTHHAIGLSRLFI